LRICTKGDDVALERLEVLQFKRDQVKTSRNSISDRFLVFGTEQFFVLILAFLLGRCSLFSRSFFSCAYVASSKKGITCTI